MEGKGKLKILPMEYTDCMGCPNARVLTNGKLSCRVLYNNIQKGCFVRKLHDKQDYEWFVNVYSNLPYTSEVDMKKLGEKLRRLHGLPEVRQQDATG